MLLQISDFAWDRIKYSLHITLKIHLISHQKVCSSRKFWFREHISFQIAPKICFACKIWFKSKMSLQIARKITSSRTVNFFQIRCIWYIWDAICQKGISRRVESGEIPHFGKEHKNSQRNFCRLINRKYSCFSTPFIV